jgi:tRNA-dihydrouridine synthase A
MIALSHRFCAAPMMDWTDRHCRFFLRQISRHARLYTEMITAPALLHGDVPRHLDFDPAEHPLALQLGGSDPVLLAHAAKLGERWGYDEINLNCGCPSERVQTGSFGACLMREPELVAQCVRAMRDAVALRSPSSTGSDSMPTRSTGSSAISLARLRTRAATSSSSMRAMRVEGPVAEGESRGAALALRRRPSPEARISGAHVRAERRLDHVDGDRARARDGRRRDAGPRRLSRSDDPAPVDWRLFGEDQSPPTRASVLRAMVPYVATQHARGVPLRSIARHMLGLYHGMPGGRRFRQLLSDAARLQDAGPELLMEALDAVEPTLAAA